MTPQEWEVSARRISALWPPAMDAEAVGAYFDVLEPLDAGQVVEALNKLARTPRQQRPRAGQIWRTVLGGDETPPAPPPRQVPEGDILTADQHRTAMAEIRRTMSAEHHRRHAAVMTLLREKGVRIPLAELALIMAEKTYTAAAFDRRIAELEPTDQLALETPR